MLVYLKKILSSKLFLNICIQQFNVSLTSSQRGYILKPGVGITCLPLKHSKLRRRNKQGMAYSLFRSSTQDDVSPLH